jgi:DNA-binding MarR family transcriptional regulator
VSESLRDEIGKRDPFEGAEQEAYLTLLRTVSVLGCDFARLFKQHGLSEATYNILRILRGEAEGGTLRAGVPMQVIGDRLVARVPDVTRLVDRLEISGLVQRLRTPDDRRVVLVSITTRGLGLLASLDGPVRAIHQRQLSHMDGAELNQLMALLDKARRSGTGLGEPAADGSSSQKRDGAPRSESC